MRIKDKKNEILLHIVDSETVFPTPVVEISVTVTIPVISTKLRK